MAAVTIRKLNDDAYRELKRRAKARGRSAEAEMREILEAAARPEEQLNLGSAIRDFVMRNGGGFDLQIERDQAPIEPAIFE
jgi:plasmid stability protein